MFTSEDQTIREAFGAFYMAPAYQREYVWGPREVEQLLQDLLGMQDRPDAQGYFLGTIVTVKTSNRYEHEVVDGQQRLTTLFLLLCGLRQALQELGGEDAEDLARQLGGLIQGSRKRLRIELQYHSVETGKVLGLIAGGDAEGLSALRRRGRGRPRRSSTDDSVVNILTACDTVDRFLRNEFVADGDVAGLVRFCEGVLDAVTLVRVMAPNLASALIAFESMNGRGLGLNSMDLVKSLVFQRLDGEHFERVSDLWREMRAAIQSSGTSGGSRRPSQFLRYFVLSDLGTGSNIVEEVAGIYVWLRDYVSDQGIMGQDAVCFARKLRDAALVYSDMRRGLAPGGMTSDALRGIRMFSPSGQTYLLPLMAARGVAPDLFARLSDELESTLFVLHACGRMPGDIEKLCIRWAAEARTSAGVEQLIQGRLRSLRQEMALEFRSAIDALRCDRTAKSRTRMRYMLGRIAEWLQREAGRAPVDVWSDELEIEHVCPTEPLADAQEECHLVDPDLLHGLGNLTLSDVADRSPAGLGFSQKRLQYAESGLVMTRLLARPPEATANVKADRFQRAMDVLGFSNWAAATTESVARRHDAMADLAMMVWRIPG